MTVTRKSEPGETLVPLDADQRGIPASMLAIGALLAMLFVALVLVMVASVAGDDTPAAPTVDDLAIPDGIEVIASMQTCTDRACDGVGLALRADGGGAPSSRLATAWRESGWGQLSCVDGGTLCFASGDLRLSITPWGEVDAAAMPMLFEAVADLSIDPRDVTFVHYYRCGANHPCE